MPDPLFAELYDDTETLNWDPADQVRARARRRTRHTRLVAGLASAVAVAVVATGAVALAEGPDPVPPAAPATNSPTPSPTGIPTTPTTPPTPSPSPSTAPPSESPETTDQPTLSPPSPDVPAVALLRTEDLPTGFRAAGDDLDGDWSFHAGTSYTCEEDGQKWPGEKAFRGAVFYQGTEGTVIERVERHSEEAAKTTMGNVRREVAGCEPLNPDNSKGMEVFASGLAGDESLLVGRSGEQATSRWLFVRQGELVAQVWLKGVDPAEDQRIAERTAARLCAGTDAC
ncbi:hypothetical protein [Salinispora vitiensis]|uniref:hypothetical protein n=1 Tax=Salinispora vitiensis TaxID=999544 RepID=UPI000365E873|nr:hypothetical protein [Salinispora vitiensis]